MEFELMTFCCTCRKTADACTEQCRAGSFHARLITSTPHPVVSERPHDASGHSLVGLATTSEWFVLFYELVKAFTDCHTKQYYDLSYLFHFIVNSTIVRPKTRAQNNSFSSSLAFRPFRTISLATHPVAHLDSPLFPSVGRSDPSFLLLF